MSWIPSALLSEGELHCVRPPTLAREGPGVQVGSGLCGGLRPKYPFQGFRACIPCAREDGGTCSAA